MVKSENVRARAGPIAKGKSSALRKMGFVKSKNSNNMVMKLRKGLLLKCGNSIKKYADTYSLHLDFDDKSMVLDLNYGKVAINDFMPTGDNWEMWYGENSVPTQFEDVNIVVEAFMFVKPYSVENDNRKGTTSYLENGYKDWVLESFRNAYPEFNGVSDEHVGELNEYKEHEAILWENNSAIQMIKVTGKLKFYAYNDADASLTKLYSHTLDSSSDFYNDVEEFLTFFEANSHDAWWNALNKFDDYVVSHGIGSSEGVVASARKSKKVKKNASDFDGRIYEILCAAENEPQQTADDGYLTILDGVPNDVLDQALSYAERIYGIKIQESARKSEVSKSIEVTPINRSFKSVAKAKKQSKSAW